MDKTGYKIVCVYLVLAFSTLAVFLQLRKCDFINYDDPTYVAENRYVKAGLTRESIIWAFTTGETANWHPLTWLSYMLDCELFGTNAGLHHLSSLFLHIINTLLLFALLEQMTGALWQSAFVAGLFALHPLHVQSVAWVSERKDVLSALFWLLTTAAYLRYIRCAGIKWYLLTLLLFVLGLMAKPMLVTLPFVLLLLDYWPLGRFEGNQTKKLILEKIPFFVLSAISSTVTFFVQQSSGAVSKIEMVPLVLRVANAFVSYSAYIEKMIWPSGLAVLYPYSNELSMQRVIASVLLLFVITFLVIRTARNHRYLLAGWLWYVGTLVPVIGLIQVGNQAMADRYTYLPSIGIFIMIAWGISEVSAKWRFREIILSTSSIAVLSAFSVCTYLQVSYWRDSISLFERAIQVTTNNFIMHFDLGLEFARRGEIDRAIEHFAKASQIKPDYAEAHYTLAVSLGLRGRIGEAVWYYRQALRAEPNYVAAQNNLAWIWATSPNPAIRNSADAVKFAEKACELTKYGQPAIMDTLAVAYAASGQFQKAVETAEKAVQLAEKSGEKDLADEIRGRLQLYKKKQVYIDLPSKVTSK